MTLGLYKQMVQISGLSIQPYFCLGLLGQILEVITTLALIIKLCFTLGFLVLIPEWPQAIHVDNTFGYNDGESLKAKILLLSTFLFFTVH
jgi:hypothetical protein